MTATINASPAQVSFLTDLAEKAATLDPVNYGDAVAKVQEWLPGRSRSQVSQAIDSAKATVATLKKSTTSGASVQDVPEGFHLLDGVIYKVQVAVHGTGRKYAKRLDPETGKFDIEHGAVRRLSEDTVLTLEQAQEFGHLYGMCARCGATLTDEESIERGIGPVCATKF